MPENTRVAVIGIIVENPGCANEINDILHLYSEYIIGRMGIPYREKNISIISVVIDAEGRVQGVTVKTAYSKK